MKANENISVEDRVEKLESLVEELLKDNPIEARIESKMAELAIQYTTDPVERINRVLAALHPYSSLDFEEDDVVPYKR